MIIKTWKNVVQGCCLRTNHGEKEKFEDTIGLIRSHEGATDKQWPKQREREREGTNIQLMVDKTLYRKLTIKSTLEKTEWAIRNGQSRETGNTRYTRHRTKKIKPKTAQKTKKMRNTDPTNNLDWRQVLANGKQFLSLIRTPVSFLM